MVDKVMDNKILKHEKQMCKCEICGKHYDKTKKQIKRISKRKIKELILKESKNNE